MTMLKIFQKRYVKSFGSFGLLDVTGNMVSNVRNAYVEGSGQVSLSRNALAFFFDNITYEQCVGKWKRYKILDLWVTCEDT